MIFSKSACRRSKSVQKATKPSPPSRTKAQRLSDSAGTATTEDPDSSDTELIDWRGLEKKDERALLKFEEKLVMKLEEESEVMMLNATLDLG